MFPQVRSLEMFIGKYLHFEEGAAALKFLEPAIKKCWPSADQIRKKIVRYDNPAIFNHRFGWRDRTRFQPQWWLNKEWATSSPKGWSFYLVVPAVASAEYQYQIRRRVRLLGWQELFSDACLRTPQLQPQLGLPFLYRTEHYYKANAASQRLHRVDAAFWKKRDYIVAETFTQVLDNDGQLCTFPAAVVYDEPASYTDAQTYVKDEWRAQVAVQEGDLIWTGVGNLSMLGHRLDMRKVRWGSCFKTDAQAAVSLLAALQDSRTYAPEQLADVKK